MKIFTENGEVYYSLLGYTKTEILDEINSIIIEYNLDREDSITIESLDDHHISDAIISSFLDFKLSFIRRDISKQISVLQIQSYEWLDTVHPYLKLINT